MNKLDLGLLPQWDTVSWGKTDRGDGRLDIRTSKKAILREQKAKRCNFQSARKRVRIKPPHHSNGCFLWAHLAEIRTCPFTHQWFAKTLPSFFQTARLELGWTAPSCRTVPGISLQGTPCRCCGGHEPERMLSVDGGFRCWFSKVWGYFAVNMFHF